MATSIQIASNRANAQHSTGPKTGAGKRASSANSLRHGLTAKQIVLPGENPAEYDELRQELHDDYAPVNTAEATLVDQIAQHTWRLQRVRRAESALWSRRMKDRDSDLAMAAVLIDDYGELERIRRYEVTIERSYHRAIEQLRKLRKERRAQEKEAGQLKGAFATAPTSGPAAETGFVSQDPGQRAGAIPGGLCRSTSPLPTPAPAGFVSQIPAETGAA